MEGTENTHTHLGPNPEGGGGIGLTFTLVAAVALAMAGGTFTLVGSDRVDAVAPGTKTRHGLALVHVCTQEAKGRK